MVKCPNCSGGGNFESEGWEDKVNYVRCYDCGETFGIDHSGNVPTIPDSSDDSSDDS